jgi:hypothetical protein
VAKIAAYRNIFLRVKAVAAVEAVCYKKKQKA